MSDSRAQLTSLLTNRDLDRLGRLRINAARRLTNRARGEHLAAKGGTSTEFCDYRDYAPGDDMRFVDWNIFSRLNRPYVKQFHHEEEMHVAILVDASSSMMFEEKFALARQLAVAFGAVGLRNQEKVSVYALRTAGVPPSLPPCSGRMSQRKLFAFLEGIEGGGDAPIERGIESFLRQHSGRGVVIVLSDFLTSGDLKRAFSLLHGSGLEVFALQILGAGEIAPEVAGDLRFVDSESAASRHQLCGRSPRDLSGVSRSARADDRDARAAALGKVPFGERGGAVRARVLRSAPPQRLDRMTFTALSSAWLAALLVPLVAFYFLKLKRPRHDVSSLVLWRQVIADQRVNSPFQKFKRNLLLLLQILLLALLVLAAMQPLLRSEASRAERLPILIDVSASMAALDKEGGLSRLDAAKRRVREMIANLPSDQQLCLIAFSRTARRLTPFTNNKTELRDALAALEVEDVAGDLEEALRTAQALARGASFDRVLLLSDGNFPAQANFELSFRIDFQRLDPAGPNFGITACNARRGVTGQWDVFVQLGGAAGAESTSGTVELVQDGATLASENVTLVAGSAPRLVFKVGGEKPSLIEVRFTPRGFDSLASDNRAWLALPAVRALDVYVPPALVSYRHALEAIDGLRLFPSGDTALPASFDLAFANSPADLALVARVLCSVGFVPPELDKLVSLASGDANVIDWRRESPLLQHVTFTDVVLMDDPRNAAGITEDSYANLGYEILAHGPQGPLMLDRQDGDNLRVHLLFHTDRSTLPYRVAFPIFVTNASAGSVQLQASNSSGSGTVTIKANSDLLARRTG